MRGRMLLAGFGVFASFTPGLAQFPPPTRGPAPAQPLPPVQIPRPPELPGPLSPVRPAMPGPVVPAGGTMPAPSVPAEPRPLPPSLLPTPPQAGLSNTPPALGVETPLPQPEAKVAIDGTALTLRRLPGGMQVVAGQRVIKNVGQDETGAREVVRVMRDLHPTEWAVIGSPRPVVEYGLTNGRPFVTGAAPPQVLRIDLGSVRVEPVRGVFCLRDDASILLNFGLAKADAQQALAVVRRYGFNRVGMAGGTLAAPALTYFFAALEAEGVKPTLPTGGLSAAAQESSLTRTGIPIPGAGYVGEMVTIDPRRVEARREGADWVVASGAEVLARFGPGEGVARDAARVVQEGRFTEFCRVGPGGLTFFLVNGRPPTRVPLSVQGRRFDPASLKVVAHGPKWAVTEAGRHLFDVTSAEEGEAVVKVLAHFRFDQMCQVGQSPRQSLVFLAKAR